MNCKFCNSNLISVINFGKMPIANAFLEKSDFKNQEHDAKSSYDMKKTMNSDPKEKTPAADIPTKEIPNKKPQKQQRQVFNQIFHETTT